MFVSVWLMVCAVLRVCACVCIYICVYMNVCRCVYMYVFAGRCTCGVCAWMLYEETFVAYRVTGVVLWFMVR